MDVIRIVQGKVELDQEGRSLHTVVGYIAFDARLGPTDPSEGYVLDSPLMRSAAMSSAITDVYDSIRAISRPRCTLESAEA